MKVLGIDPSLRRTGLCLLTDGDPQMGRIETRPDIPTDERLRRIWRELRGIAARNRDITVVAIEGYAFGKIGNSNAVTKLAEVVGIARAVMMEVELPVVVVPNPTWRSVTMGTRLRKKSKKTAADREDYLEAVRRKHGYSFKTTDDADAFLIAKCIEMIAAGRAVMADGVQNIAEALAEAGITVQDMQRQLTF